MDDALGCPVKACRWPCDGGVNVATCSWDMAVFAAKLCIPYCTICRRPSCGTCVTATSCRCVGGERAAVAGCMWEAWL